MIVCLALDPLHVNTTLMLQDIELNGHFVHAGPVISRSDDLLLAVELDVRISLWNVIYASLKREGKGRILEENAMAGSRVKFLSLYVNRARENGLTLLTSMSQLLNNCLGPSAAIRLPFSSRTGGKNESR